MQGLPEIGEVLDGTYKVEKLIGTGGFGAVYLARQLSMDREVALKILVANAMNVDEMIQRFRREVMACRSLGHPNTIRIYDFRDRPDGILYYTMEYVNGPTLKDIIKDDGPLPPLRVAHILKQICKSLAEAHSFGIIHRDLKPANIMLADIAGETDFVKVVDFGIAKILEDDGEDRDQLTNAGVLVGTLNYMSPEQIQGGEIGPGSDLYALGLIAIEMLMGRSVFEGTGRWEVLHKQISDEPVDIPQEVIDSGIGNVLQTALKKSASERYGKAEEMLRALNALTTLSDAPLVEVADNGTPEVIAAPVSASLPMPEALPVESEPPLPEAVRPATRTKSLAESTSPGDDDAFDDDVPTSMHDSGVSANPLHQTARAPVQEFRQSSTPAPAVQVAQPSRQPMHSPVPDGFVPSGDTDPGPTSSGNKGLVGVLVVVVLLIGAAAVALTQVGDDPPPEEPPQEIAVKDALKPAVTVKVEEPEIPDEVVEKPAETIPTKTIRLVTEGIRAEVFDGDELIGQTPLRFPVGAKKRFTLRAEGYEDQQIELSSKSDDRVEVGMKRVAGHAPVEKPKQDKTPEKQPEKKPDPKPEKKPDDWIDVTKKKPDVPDVPVF